MSLSMQISRGVLALSMLLLLGLLLILAKPQARAEVGLLPVAASVSMCDGASTHASAWRFAQTPADLGRLARRWDSCRA